jgi:hypothetical protein
VSCIFGVCSEKVKTSVGCVNFLEMIQLKKEKQIPHPAKSAGIRDDSYFWGDKKDRMSTEPHQFQRVGDLSSEVPRCNQIARTKFYKGEGTALGIATRRLRINDRRDTGLQFEELRSPRGTLGFPGTVAPFRAWRGSRDLVARSPKFHVLAVAQCSTARKSLTHGEWLLHLPLTSPTLALPN